MNLRFRVLLCAAVLCGSAGAAHAADWQTYLDKRCGYSVAYPASLFGAPTPYQQYGVRLGGLDGRAQLFLFGGPNPSVAAAGQVADRLATLDDVRVVTYRRVGNTWLVLSGYIKPTNNIFYERVQLGQGNRFLSGFRIEYPASERGVFDALIGPIASSLTSPQTCR